MESGEHGVIGFTRRHPMAAYLTWFFTVGWAIAFTPAVADAAWGVELPFQPFAIATTLVAGLLPAIVITRIVDGPEGLDALKRRILRVRVGVGWYAMALIAIPLTAVALAVLAFGAPPAGTSTLTTALVSGFLLQTVLTFVTINLAEEIGWMGFVQARVQDSHGPLKAALFTGPLFALQHLPGMLGFGSALVVVLPVLIVIAIGYRLTVGWIYNGTASLFLAGLAHAAANGVTGGSGFIGDGFLPRVYDNDLVATFHLVAMFGLGAALLAATRGRLGYPPPGAGDRLGAGAPATPVVGARA
jgi:membrane protease YdiL (CAAX protease family)